VVLHNYEVLNILREPGRQKQETNPVWNSNPMWYTVIQCVIDNWFPQC
jgi:hypothetical protein